MRTTGRTAWTYLGLVDGGGLTNSIDDDVPVAADGTFSKTFTLNSSNVMEREIRLSTRDDFDRGFMSTKDYKTGFFVGGTINGLSGSVVLRLNNGSDLTLSAPGTFTFGPTIPTGTTYSVTVVTQPAHQVCGPGVTNGSGTINGANVTNVSITCTAYSVGGTVTGLTGAGLVLQVNGANDFGVAAGSTTLAIPSTVSLAPGITYDVQIKTQPTGQTCTVVRPMGYVVAAAPTVNNIGLECVDNVTDPLSGTYKLTSLGGQAGDRVPSVPHLLSRWHLYLRLARG